MALVLSGSVIAIVWIAYFELHRSILASVHERLEVATQEVGTLLRASLARPTREAALLAATPEITAAVAMESAETREAASERLRRHRDSTKSQGAYALWSFDGELLAAAGPDGLVQATRPAPGLSTVSDSGIVGQFIKVDSGFAYGVSMPVKIRGRDVGILVRAQQSNPGTTTNSNSALIGRLVGDGTRLFIGNADGSLWTDLARVVAAPVANPGTNPIEFEGDSGIARVGLATPIAGSPWSIWIDLPENSSSIGAVHGFRPTGVLIAAIVALLGAFTTTLVVRRVAREHDSQELGERARLLEAKNDELHRSELRFRQLVEHFPDALLVHRGGTIIFTNAVAARVLGLPDAESLRGRNLFDFIDPEDREEGPDRLGVNASDDTPSPLSEVRLIRDDRSRAIVEATAMAVTLDEGHATQTILRDVTERRLLEDQLRQSQKMEAVGRLAGGVAHDFNNLLTVIHTYTEMMLHESRPGDQHHEDLKEVLHAARSAAGLTRQMLAFSRKQVLEPTQVDLNSAIGGVIGMIKRIIGDHIEVRTNFREGISSIWADAGQLEQVLINLAVNARDAMPAGGLLRIETANARLESGYSSYHGRTIPAGDYVLLSVADTGIGMPEEVQRKIFEPFFTTKEAGRGTGLGLSTVYGIVKQSEGYIWVYSEPGQGTVFKIYFPRYVGDEEPEVLPIAERKSGRDRALSVLLVEDERHVRAAVRRVLETQNYQVTEADHPASAQRMIDDSSRSFDLLITDMMMPQKTGADLVRELTARRPELRAIIMSGYSEEATSRQWRLPPNALFIEKPIEPSELFRKIHEAFGWGD